MEKIKIYKWNIYTAKVPYTTNFSKNKERLVIVISIIGDDLVILPISTKIHKKQKWDFDIELNNPSIIQIGNIQSINKNDIINPYYRRKEKVVSKIDLELQKEILASLNNIFS
ncbi:type II toxin-antitoxin system PemK/MazF family toxin [Spiroplasma platyhelix]|uniref:Type II toxin-antitoxin system PemK/MazF family toxin n=1 Tax=Spiroplasma platyhelix PALS-1 TaxID=1276218 RepID=A0A846U5B2_9MOLU|nr:type II toxin-antitoxin system PemK/MazF family toxin [Spiroplasma platyhelix]MBE4704274.1 hypothetical protein [Spiroplasma platyhelix PALS-1]NKE38647.1 type II toxin-antitoxin system PemK/MazF family toxin [Spiroplasma platyhelix PALS-1]UJB28858.1 hypothetical protein SPLAT_v1c00910 [Spiroplasma platyhelix PALS-1]